TALPSPVSTGSGSKGLVSIARVFSRRDTPGGSFTIAVFAVHVGPELRAQGSIKMKRPSDAEYAPYYTTYVSLVPEADVMAVLEAQPAQLRRLAGGIDAGHETFRYAPGKW